MVIQFGACKLHFVGVIMVIEVHEPNFMSHNLINNDPIADMATTITSQVLG